MTVALMGSNGYIAQYVLKRLQQNSLKPRIIKIEKENLEDTCFLDLNKPEKFDYTIFKEIDYLIFTAAISSPDKCAEEFDACWKINVTGTEYVIRNAIKRGCKVIFFSSDAVFGDIPGMIYEEGSQTCAKTAYGLMKKKIEDIFRGEDDFKAIRLSYVVSKKDKFTSYCLSCMQKERAAEIYHPFYRNCITVGDVLDVVEWLLENWEKLPSNYLNIAGYELVSRIRFADEINRIYKGRLKYRVVTPEKHFYQNRPSITQMKSRYLHSLNIVPMRTFTEMIYQELEEVKYEP